MKGFTVSSQLIKANPLVDNGMSVGFHTKELSAEEKLGIMSHFQKTGWLLFSEDEVQEADVPETKSEFETKTPSQRLRGVMYVYWEQQGSKGKFEDFYREKMENFIEIIKSKLDQ